MEQVKKEVQQLNEFKEQVKNEFQEIREHIQTNTTGRTYATVVAETQSLKEQITQLKEKVEINHKASNAPRQEKEINMIEPAIQELQDREKRARNVLVFGVPEAPNVRSKDEEDTISKERAVKFLKKLKADLSTDTIKAYRLGYPSENKIRPIRVILPTRMEASEILHLKNQLKDDSVYLKYDQTETQRTYLKNTLKELERRTNSGENDLIIKYVKGKPTITKIAANRQPKNFGNRSAS